MWRIRTLVGLTVLAGMLIFGALVAHGGWYWNSKIDVEGAELRTIWEITDSAQSLYLYHANVVVRVPKKASASITEVNTNETVKLRKSKKLKCLPNDIEVKVIATITAGQGATGTQAKVTIQADGVVIGQKTGPIGNTIKQKVLVPATC